MKPNVLKATTVLSLTFGLLALAGFKTDSPKNSGRTSANSASADYASAERFVTGEHLEYRVHYGFINAAEATVDVSNRLHQVNNRPCYRVDVNGRTTGAFDLVTRVRDTWQSYIDTSTILPQAFYMSQREGKYRKNQKVHFDHASAKVISKDEEETIELKSPGNLHDVISGYFYLRTLDFGRMREGEVVSVKAFYDNEFYDMRVRYGGREIIGTKFGSINAFKIIPMMPNKNNFFEDNDSIRIWVSDDENRVPIKAEVDLALGSIEMDLKKYKGLKKEMRWF
ncbi:MAG: DUF3108 domain-containing protein [Cytophagaceae bacterium]|nr:DUF3108 domain-containing protein [Cytophagaceae bacterium]